MDYNFENRINFKGNVSDIAQLFVEQYDIKDLSHVDIIKTGYEDLNLKIQCHDKLYLLKIFNAEKNKNSYDRADLILSSIASSPINAPKVYNNANNTLLTTVAHTYGQDTAVLMDWIEGKTLYDENSTAINPTHIPKIIKKIHAIQALTIKPDFYYDSWAIINFEKEFKDKSYLLNTQELQLLQPQIANSQTIPWHSLPVCFCHGDMIKTNIIVDKSNNLNIIDLSVANIYPRILDLAVLFSTTLLDTVEPTHIQHCQEAIELYQSKSELLDTEKQALPKMIQLAHAMHVLQCSVEKKLGNNSDENNYWLQQGLIGLKMDYSKL